MMLLLLSSFIKAENLNIFGFYPSSNKSLFSEQDKFMLDLALFVEILHAIEGLEISGRELGRTLYQQKRYIHLGLSKTWNSKHLEFLAIDMEFMLDGKLITSSNSDLMKSIGYLWESLDDANEAGMFWKWKDNGHFQRNKYKGFWE